MRLDIAFLLGHYLTLGLAGACLAIALEPARPERAVVVCVLAGLFSIGLLLKAPWMRGSRAEDGFKVALAAAAGWATFTYLRHTVGQTSDIPSQKTNWGPPLVVSLPLLLPGVFVLKRLGPFWGLQGLGLTAVALSCAWGDDSRLELLWPAYLLCGLWTLALFDLRRRQALAQVSADAPPGNPGGAVLRLPWRYLGAVQVASWALVAGVPGVILFLFTSDFCIGEADRLQSGLGDARMDLNQTGTLRLNPAVALMVSVARADGSAGSDLSPSQRFRGATLEVYEQGHWFNGELQAIGPPTFSPDEIPDARLPYLGPKAAFLTFTPQLHPPRVPVLVEPVTMSPSREPLPVLTLADDGRRLPWAKLADGTLLPRVVPRQGPFRYLQVNIPSGTAAQSFQPKKDYLEQLLRPAPRPIQQRTTELLARIAAQHRLTTSDLRVDAAGNLPAASHEAVARALEAHLSRSGEYRYSLTLERRDLAIDPTADFLVNVKRGHCARYASALALMLRSQGIPARIVLGYSGVERRGEGVFLIRESRAHSWVEALVRRPGADGRLRWYWLTLDPTPAQPGSGTVSGDWQEGRVSWRRWLDSGSSEQRTTLITRALDRVGLASLGDRASDRIEELRQRKWSWHDVWPWLAAAGVVMLAVWQLRRLRRRPVLLQPCESGEYDFYYRLLTVLARRCRLRPQPAQTPREFGEIAGLSLQGRGIAALATVPHRVVALYYRLRYGRWPISDVEHRDIEGQIDQLEDALHGRRRPRPEPVEKPPSAE